MASRSPFSGIARSLARLNAGVRNGLEIARLGGLGSVETSPFEIAAEAPNYRLRRYFSNGESARPAILLVPPLMLTTEVWDVSPEASAVRLLHANGADPWVVDFGAPERERGGLSRTLADHVVAVSDAVDRARERVKKDVHLGGYSQGGMFCYQAAAYRRSEGLRSLVTFGSPVDVHKNLPPAIPGELGIRALSTLGSVLAPLLTRGFVPAWVSRTGFRLLDPVKDVQQQIEFLLSLWDREKILKREAQRRFLATEGWVAYPGPALADFLDQIIAHNRMLSGGLVVDGRTVTLADITCPVLAFVGETDEIARPATVRAVRKAAPRAEVYEVSMRVGHFGLVVGSKSAEITWPTVAGWLCWREQLGELPERVRRLEKRVVDAKSEPPAPELEDLRESASLVWSVGRDAVTGLLRAAGETAGAVQRLAETALPQLPRLARLVQVRRRTRIGMGLVLAEQAKSQPESTFFLFEGRAYSYADANRRVDAVVRGLISVGVRHGQHVGVLMRTRPSALAAVAALNRLGAVTVLLRPDGPLAQEIAVGGVEHVLSDPEYGERAHAAFGAPVLVLGGGAPRSLPEGQIDLERVDPDKVRVPSWYDPNPGRAGDIAVVLFSGRDDQLRMRRITNRRWALAAFGTASAAALTSRDTVYCCTPLHHPTGALVCLGGALAGGARLAVATRFEPATFWDEVRRYGVTVVFYAGAMLAELVHAPQDLAERDHPVRLFAGSGMPKNIWRRLLQRFAPVSLLELYASTEGNAVLVNLSGEKIGSLGTPLPGSAELEIAAFDFQRRELALGEDGFAERCGTGETGLLLSRVEPERGAAEGKPLRGVFEKGDAWLSTGDLFRRDGDGDYWLVDHVADLIDAAEGPIPSIPIEDAVAAADAVALAVAYGVRLEGGRSEIPVAAVELRPEKELSAEELARAVEPLPPSERPAVVRIVDDLPLTAGFRPLKEPLRREGVDPARAQGRALWLDPEAGLYRPLDAAGYDRFRAAAGASSAGHPRSRPSRRRKA